MLVIGRNPGEYGAADGITASWIINSRTVGPEKYLWPYSISIKRKRTPFGAFFQFKRKAVIICLIKTLVLRLRKHTQPR